MHAASSQCKKYVFYLLIFSLSYIFYLHTMFSSLNVGDNGEFISAAYTLGIAHPPGYPLYSVTGKIFSFLPLGNIAFRINLLSVISACTALMLLFYFFNSILNIKGVIALSGIFIFMVSRTFWSCATGAEVYILNTVIIILIFISLYKNKIPESAFLIGLGLTIHHTSLLFIPVFIWLIFEKIKNFKSKEKIYLVLNIFFYFLIGISIYLFLLIRAGKSPAINCGNPETIGKLLRHFMRTEYEPFSRIYSFKKISMQFFYYLKSLKEQFHVILWLCVPIGWLGAWKTKQRLLIASIIVFIFTTFGFMLLINYETNPLNIYLAEVYFIPSYIIFLYWILEGIVFISYKINKLYANEFLACAVLITGFFILNKNYFYNNSRSNMAAYHYGEDILFTLPHNAYFITKGDNQLFSLFYLKLVENRRKDLKIDPGTKKYIFKDQEISPDTDNFFFSEKEDAILIGNTEIIPYGLVYTYTSPQKIVRTKSEFWNNYKNRNIEQKEYYKDYLLTDLLVKYLLQHGENFYAKGKKEEAFKEYKKALLEGADIYEPYFEFGMRLFSKNRFNDAIFEFEKIILLYPERAQTYNYLGVANAQIEKFKEALKYLLIAVEKDPRNSNYLYNLSITYFKNGEPSKAQKTLEQALKINSEDKKINELMKFIAK